MLSGQKQRCLFSIGGNSLQAVIALLFFGEKGRGMAEKAALRGCRRLGMRQRQKTVQDITAATYVGILFTVFLV